MKKQALIIAGVFVLLILSMCFYIVKEGEVAIKLRLGQVVASDIWPGIHFKIPMVETLNVYDARLQTLDAQPEQVLTQEKKELLVDYFVEWRIEDTERFYVSTRGSMQRAESIIAQIATDDLRGEFAKRTVNEVVSKDRSQIMVQVTKSLSTEVESQGLKVVDVRVKRVEFSDSIKGSVYERMRSERTRVSNSLRAEGRKEEAFIKSKTDRDVAVILANANRDAEILRGEGEAEATRIYAEAFSQDEDFYRFQKSLEAYQSSFNSKEDWLITSPDSSFFQYLESAN